MAHRPVHLVYLLGPLQLMGEVVAEVAGEGEVEEGLVQQVAVVQAQLQHKQAEMRVLMTLVEELSSHVMSRREGPAA